MPLHQFSELSLAPRSTSDPHHIADTERDDRIRRRNRRKRYLDLNAETYFTSSLELADVLLYDQCIRRFQSTQEREAEGRAKGFSGILEADMCRSEAKREALRNPQYTGQYAARRGPDGEILAEDKHDKPANREDARARWVDEMTQRFLSGGDDDFDYSSVDGNEAYDDLAEETREAEERYFGSQKPEFELCDGAEPSGETGVQDY